MKLFKNKKNPLTSYAISYDSGLGIIYEKLSQIQLALTKISGVDPIISIPTPITFDIDLVPEILPFSEELHLNIYQNKILFHIDHPSDFKHVKIQLLQLSKLLGSHNTIQKIIEEPSGSATPQPLYYPKDDLAQNITQKQYQNNTLPNPSPLQSNNKLPSSSPREKSIFGHRFSLTRNSQMIVSGLYWCILSLLIGGIQELFWPQWEEQYLFDLWSFSHFAAGVWVSYVLYVIVKDKIPLPQISLISIMAAFIFEVITYTSPSNISNIAVDLLCNLFGGMYARYKLKKLPPLLY